MAENILAIDVGLTNCKIVVFDHAGRLLARGSAAYQTHYPQPGWVEQDPEEWWAALLAGITQLRERAPEALDGIVAVSVTGHMHALVCTASDGTALGRSLVLGDQRSLAEAGEISAELGMERIYAITGARMDASMPAAKLRWLHRHAPDVHARTRAYLACKDWIRHQLTGDLSTDPIDACGTSLYDIQRRAWSPELVQLAGVQPSQLPLVSDPWALAGQLTKAAAATTGLQAGTPVVVGAGDDVEVLGNGLLGPGRVLEHLGTTGSILTCADQPVVDPLMAVELYPHVVPDLWVLGGSITAAGSALAWAERLLRGEPSLPAAAESQSGASRPDLERPLIFVPHLQGERCPAWEPHTRGSWIGLTTAHTPHDLRQAVLEGVAFSLRMVLERIESLVGPQREITVSRQDSEDDRWLALRASIYRRPLALLETSEPTALGAMILAAAGVGMYGSVAEAVQSVIGYTQLVEPQADLAQDYERLYDLYRASLEATGALMRRWAAES